MAQRWLGGGSRQRRRRRQQQQDRRQAQGCNQFLQFCSSCAPARKAAACRAASGRAGRFAGASWGAESGCYMHFPAPSRAYLWKQTDRPVLFCSEDSPSRCQSLERWRRPP